MRSADHSQRKEMLARVVALSVECPFDRSNPDVCPLHEVRKMERKKREAWIGALSDEDLKYVLTYHEICLATKVF